MASSIKKIKNSKENEERKRTTRPEDRAGRRGTKEHFLKKHSKQVEQKKATSMKRTGEKKQWQKKLRNPGASPLGSDEKGGKRQKNAGRR